MYDKNYIGLNTFDYDLKRLEKAGILEHAERVAQICYVTVVEFNYENKYREFAYLAGLLHEVGKLNLSSDLNDFNLLLPNNLPYGNSTIPLDDVYPYLSAAIIACRGINCKVVANIVVQCQENYDGTGYPYGLDGDQIGELARILRVADVYDHVRDKLTHEEAINYIKQNINVMFHEEIANSINKIIIRNGLHTIYH